MLKAGDLLILGTHPSIVVSIGRPEKDTNYVDYDSKAIIITNFGLSAIYYESINLVNESVNCSKLGEFEYFEFEYVSEYDDL